MGTHGNPMGPHGPMVTLGSLDSKIKERERENICAHILAEGFFSRREIKKNAWSDHHFHIECVLSDFWVKGLTLTLNYPLRA